MNPEVPIETLCQDAGGTIITSNNGSKFCYCSSSACSGNWDDINNWCERNGMAMPSIDDVCPTWTKSLGPGQCPEFVDVYPGIASAFTSTLSRDGYAYAIASIYGSVMEEDITRYVSVFCHLPPR